MCELEYKRMLTKEQYALVDKLMTSEVKTKQQINHYYDTSDLYFNRNRVTVRVRQKEQMLNGTIKLHDVLNPLHSEEDDFSVDSLPPVIRYNDRILLYKGQLTTNRKTLKLADGVWLMLDENYYLGKIDYELELEYSVRSGDKAKRAIARVDSCLQRNFPGELNVSSQNKSQRFFRALQTMKSGDQVEINIKHY